MDLQRRHLLAAAIALVAAPASAFATNADSGRDAQPAAPRTQTAPTRSNAGGMLAGPLDWQAALAASGASGRPIVAMFSLPGCPYCLAVRRSSLAPLAADAAASGVIVVEFDITDERPFASDPATSPKRLAQQLGIRFTPTVAFFGPAGELAPRLVGYGVPDFYDAYLQQRIAQARAALETRR